jgi:hypothetical protein
VESKGNGSGTVYLKNYIPPKGESGDNGVFIAMNKAGMVDYSIVSYTRDVVQSTPDGEPVRQCVESLYGERNDAVDLGSGAMDMKTNAAEPEAFSAAKKLIAEGKVDKLSSWAPGSGDLELAPGYPYGKAGIVFRSALRHSSARAAQDGRPELTDIANELIKNIDAKASSIGGRTMGKKEEVLGDIATLKQNAEITLPEIAKAMGLEGQIKTNADAEAAAKLNAIQAELGEGDPIAQIKAMKAQINAGAETARENAIVALVGPKKNAEGVANDRYTYVEKETRGLVSEKLNAALEGLKDDPIMKRLNAEAADMNSEVNRVAPKQNGADQASGFESGAAVEL